MIIPIRDLDVAAASRVRNTGYGSDLHTFGGLFGTARATRQREALALIFYELMYTIARYDLPHTLLLFPRFADGLGVHVRRSSAFLAPDDPAGALAGGARRVAPTPTLIHEEPLTLGGAGQDLRRHVLQPRHRAPAAGRAPACSAAATATGRRPTRTRERRPTRTASSCTSRAGTPRAVDRAVHPVDAPLRGPARSSSSSATAARPTARSRCCAGFESAGWLRLEVAPGGPQARRVARPLGRARARPASPVFSRLGRRVPRARVARRPGHRGHARATPRSTCARMQWPPPEFRHPTTGAARRLAPRPTPWLFLLDLDQVRGRVDASFRYRDEVDPDAFGGKVAYDVGAAYFAALRRAGLTWTEMPEAFQAKFRHFGGLTWLKAGQRRGVVAGAGQAARQARARARAPLARPRVALGRRRSRRRSRPADARRRRRARRPSRQPAPMQRRACGRAAIGVGRGRRGPASRRRRAARARSVAASSSASPGGTTQPVPSSRTVSPSAPTSDTTTGSRCAYASCSTALCDAKLVYGSTMRSAAACSSFLRSAVAYPISVTMRGSRAPRLAHELLDVGEAPAGEDEAGVGLAPERLDRVEQHVDALVAAERAEEQHRAAAARRACRSARRLDRPGSAAGRRRPGPGRRRTPRRRRRRTDSWWTSRVPACRYCAGEQPPLDRRRDTRRWGTTSWTRGHERHAPRRGRRGRTRR